MVLRCSRMKQDRSGTRGTLFSVSSARGLCVFVFLWLGGDLQRGSWECFGPFIDLLQLVGFLLLLGIL